jgi:hypothetical protein
MGSRFPWSGGAAGSQARKSAENSNRSVRIPYLRRKECLSFINGLQWVSIAEDRPVEGGQVEQATNRDAEPPDGIEQKGAPGSAAHVNGQGYERNSDDDNEHIADGSTVPGESRRQQPV